jgi:hypothetical protein
VRTPRKLAGGNWTFGLEIEIAKPAAAAGKLETVAWKMAFATHRAQIWAVLRDRGTLCKVSSPNFLVAYLPRMLSQKNSLTPLLVNFIHSAEQLNLFRNNRVTFAGRRRGCHGGNDDLHDLQGCTSSFRQTTPCRGLSRVRVQVDVFPSLHQSITIQRSSDRIRAATRE